MKKIAIGITSILSVSCLMGAALSLNSATANASEANLYMVDGASVRLSAVKSGIGFTTRVNYDYYNTLDETYDVVTGTLILPTDYLTANEITTVTHETLTAKGEAGVFFQDVVNQGWKNTATASKDGYYEYRGSLVNLNKGNYDREFSAVGYIGYKTAEADTYTYEYTEYDVANNSRAIDDVAFNAFVDRTQTEQTVNGVEYKYEVSKDSTYSRYTGDELGILKGYMRTTAVTADGVVITQEEDGALEYVTLKATAEANNFNANAISSVTRNEKIVEFTENSVDVSLNGVYDVTLSGETAYTNGAIIPATLTASYDVWSEATKNVMIAVEDIFAIGGYEYQAFIAEDIDVGEYTVDGKTQKMLCLTGAGRECGVLVAMPLHSKAYYEQFIAENIYTENYIAMDWYFQDLTGKSDVTPCFDMFSNYEKQGAQTKNTWLEGEMNLDHFMSKYDEFVAMYERTLAEYALGRDAKYGRFVDNKGVCDPQGNVVEGYIIATKFQNDSLARRLDYAYFTPMMIEFGEMNIIETTELVDRNSKSSITPSLTAEEQAVIDYWNNQGYTISYEFVKRYSDGTPISKANSVEALATFTIDSTVEDGIYFLNAIATKGENKGVCLSKWYDIYDATSTTVEYENFKHSDSEYAVVAYAAEFKTKLFGQDSGGTVDLTWFENQLFYKYNVAFGTDTSVKNEDGTVSYSATYKEQALTYDENTIYMMSGLGKVTLGTGTSETGISDPYFQNRELGYIEYSWASWATHEKLDVLEGKISTEQGYVITQVIPRHSKAYYVQMQANGTYGDFSVAFKGTNKAKTLYFTNVSEGKLSMKGWTVGSANNQNVSANVVGTMDSFIANYDWFAKGKVPMFIMKQVTLSTSSGAARLYEIGFEKK